jgi:hypothetical protein
MKRGYSKKKRCADCGRLITNQAKKCKSCAHKKPKNEEKHPPLLAWRYDCVQCGVTAYVFEPQPEIRDSQGHSVRRGGRVICFGGKFCNPCPLGGQHPNDHTLELRDEMFYVALCPSKSQATGMAR